MRDTVVISLLTLVLQRGQDWYVFAHCHFILYTYVTSDDVVVLLCSTSLSSKTGSRTLTL